ncbi:MAG TPA: hypothetical protein VKP66_05205, partial [Steroidobacteraceae bacterium]|nr:hypothetical protein [Steroidobacteraceae bacterium]
QIGAVCGMCSVTSLLGAIGAAGAEEPSFSTMAPVEQYRMASRSEEISLARSAAPPSISGDAEVLVLGDRGYETAVKGKNGFVCLVERSWFASFGDPVFWNPQIRGPDCLNASAASTVLPANLEKTQWALAGLSKAEMLTRAKSSAAAQRAPAPGSMGYMMSKQQQLSSADGHWHPHLMFFLPHTPASAWGGNLPGSPVMGAESNPDEPTIFVVPVGKWSDGTSAPAS